MKTKRTGEVFQLELTENNHLALPFVPRKVTDEEVRLGESISVKEKMKKLKKIHHVMGHPQAQKTTPLQ